MEFYCSAQPQGLVPLYASDHDQYRRIKRDAVVKVTVTMPRNGKFHRKFFALARLVHDNLPDHIASELGVRTVDDMVRAFKIDLGLYDERIVRGRAAIELRSISFAAMDQTEFEQFYRQCLTLAACRYLRGVSEATIEDELRNFY